MRAIRTQARNVGALLLLALISGGVAVYVLSNQRLRFPWEPKPYEMRFAFSTAQAVTPGQGQTVRVSGIRVGDISKVTLRDGTAIVTAQMDRDYRNLVHTDATALLRPKTGLKDMFIELQPGSRRAPLAKPGFTLPVSNTLPDVNPDEIFAALDADTRDYLELLVNGAGTGLKGRGNSLQEVLARFEPTHRDIARVTRLVAERHRNLKRLVHSLAQLNGELAGKSEDLAQLVTASSAVFGAFASEQQNLQGTLARLPAALRQTTQTLTKVQAFAGELAPAAEALRPAARGLTAANAALTPFAKKTTPILATQIRPFVRESRPLVRSLRPASQQLSSATPDLTRSMTVLNQLFNLLGYNPDGRQGPGISNREEGYLFWIAWLQHNGASVFSGQDANGVFRPVTVSAACGTIKQVADSLVGGQIAFAPALLDPKVCGT